MSGRGLMIAELFELFPHDALSEQSFVERRWPDGVRCPFRGSDDVQDGAAHGGGLRQ